VDECKPLPTGLRGGGRVADRPHAQDEGGGRHAEYARCVIHRTAYRCSLCHSLHSVPVLAVSFTAQCTGARCVIHHIVYRCSLCHPPHSVPVLATSSTTCAGARLFIHRRVDPRLNPGLSIDEAAFIWPSEKAGKRLYHILQIPKTESSLRGRIKAGAYPRPLLSSI